MVVYMMGDGDVYDGVWWFRRWGNGGVYDGVWWFRRWGTGSVDDGDMVM